MKFNRVLLYVATSVALCLGMTSCGDEESDSPNTPDGPTPTSKKIAENIVGEWLLDSSSKDAWITYEFTESSRIHTSIFENSKISEGSGFYWINEELYSITGSYNLEDGKTNVIDWIVESISSFEVSMKIYNDDNYLGTFSLYRILSCETFFTEKQTAIDFIKICGTDKVSDIKVLNNDIAEVTSDGKVTGKKPGATYLTFNTDNGHAAIAIEIQQTEKTFAELVVGSWIYDNVKEKSWQKTTFTADGYVEAYWTNPYDYSVIEYAAGSYSLSDISCKFSVTTNYNVTYNQTWETLEINEFIWTYKDSFDSEYVGTYTGKRLLGTKTMSIGERFTPQYEDLTFGYEILGYMSNDKTIATADIKSGEITAVAKGRTYINVKTSRGMGVFEVYVE